MGKHAEWRKLVKKLRRKRIRRAIAKERDSKLDEEQIKRESSPTYQRWVEEQNKAVEYQAEEEARLSAEQEAQWRKTEEEAQKQWKILQERIAQAREERAKQNAKIIIEWEREQQKLKELKEKHEKELEERIKLQKNRDEEIQEFITNGGDTPEHLKAQYETNPSKPLCPFFQKTSVCRFYDNCSRNHVRPAVSEILLIPNFFTHYSLEKSENEHGTDSSLEFEKEETYEHYREFFYDVVSEMEKCGKIRQFRTCCNHESHLRGNVYVEYFTTREALIGYQTFNGRWYGGKQITIEFCKIDSWKAAICGLYFKNRCPKGNACNFLHVFRNPENMYTPVENENQRKHKKRQNSLSERSNWRWSESPENVRLSSEWDDECESRSSSRSRDTKRSRKTSRRSQRSRSPLESRNVNRHRTHSSSRDTLRKRKSRSSHSKEPPCLHPQKSTHNFDIANKRSPSLGYHRSSRS